LGSIDNIFFEAIFSDNTKRYLDVAETFLKTVTRSKICAAICGPVLEFLWNVTSRIGKYRGVISQSIKYRSINSTEITPRSRKIKQIIKSRSRQLRSINLGASIILRALYQGAGSLEALYLGV
jgi:hypothetical protein